MRRSSLLTVAVILAFAIGVGVLVATRPLPVPDFEWGIQIGDMFRYEVTIHGEYPQMGSISLETFNRILLLEGTTIVANVTQLPTLVGITNSSTFFAVVTSVSKVVCSFDNGSEIDGDLVTKIASAISGCILPIGGWPFVDSIYQDKPLELYYDLRSSCLYSDHLYFGCASMVYDSYEGWSGNVSLSNGAPSNAHWWYRHQYWTIYIELTLATS